MQGGRRGRVFERQLAAQELTEERLVAVAAAPPRHGLDERVPLRDELQHACVVLPAGFVKKDKVELPQTVTFTGRLFGESELLAVAHAYQRATGFHLRRPPMEGLKKKD